LAIQIFQVFGGGTGAFSKAGTFIVAVRDLQAQSWAVSAINCQGPKAPTLERADDFNSDSITARYFNSTGRPYREKTESIMIREAGFFF